MEPLSRGHRSGGLLPLVDCANGSRLRPPSAIQHFDPAGLIHLSDEQLFQRYTDALLSLSPDFQTEKGYEIVAPGKANLSMSTAQLAERYGAVSMTLEMPFKDNESLPDPREGWSPDRSRNLARACLGALHLIIDDLEKRR